MSMISTLPIADTWWTRKQLIPVAWAGWFAFLIVIVGMVGQATIEREQYAQETGSGPYEYSRTVTHHYRGAAEHWIHSENMYFQEGQHGWLYLPQGAVLYVPFLVFSLPVGEIVYRILIVFFYAWAVWRLAKLLHPDDKPVFFPMMTLLLIPVAAASMRNGQMNAPLAACFMHATVDISRRNWWRAALTLALAWMCKPIALVMILLAMALYPPLLWRIPVGILITFLIPFIHPDPGYVTGQFREGFHKVIEAGSPGAGSFEDIRGLLYGFKINLPSSIMTAARGASALGVLILSWLGLKRYGHYRGTLLLYGLAMAYLMVFNPRTEGNSYLIAAPTLLVFALIETMNQRKEWAYTLVLFCVGLWAIHIATGTPFPVPRPLILLVFLIYLAVIILQNQDIPTSSESAMDQPEHTETE